MIPNDDLEAPLSPCRSVQKHLSLTLFLFYFHLVLFSFEINPQQHNKRMPDALVLLGSAAFVFLMSSILVLLTRKKFVEHKDEIRVGLIGALVFGYIAWACIYMAQIKPFVHPS